MKCFSQKQSKWTLTLLATLVSFSLFCSTKSAHAQEEVGLTGLLPFELPEGITEDDFANLPESWGEWSEETLKQLNNFYGFEVLSIDQQRESLGSIEANLDMLDHALSHPDYAPAYDELIDLGGKLHRRVAILQAMLDTLERNPKQKNKLRPVLKELFQAIEDFEADALLGQSDTQVRRKIAAIRTITANNAQSLQEVIRIYYFNFNVRTYISEPFTESIFHECRRESGPVRDYILGARVRGTQHTKSGVSINFLPSDHDARFNIQLSGKTKSKTRGVTKQATIYTYGQHYFSGKKLIRFDGDSFSSSRAKLSVNPNNRVTDAHLNKRNLISKWFGDDIAYKQAVKKKPETEAIAAQRLRSKVLPKFNREVESTFGDLNDELTSLEQRLEAESLAPDEKLVRTDSDEMRFAYRLMNNSQMGADRPATALNSKTGMTLHIHESWINNALAIEGFHVENPEMSFPDLGEMLAAKFQRAFNLDDKLKKADDDGDRVILSDVDPIHVQFDGGKIKIIMRIGLKQAGKEDIIKLRRVEIPINLSVEDNSILLQISKDDKVRVLPLDPSDRQPISNRIMGAKIRSKFEEALAKESFDRTFDLPVDEDGDKKVAVTVDSLHAVNGWLVIVLEEAKPTDE